MGPFIQRPKVVIEFGLKSENVQKGSQRRRGVVDPGENEKALKNQVLLQRVISLISGPGNIDVWLI